MVNLNSIQFKIMKKLLSILLMLCFSLAGFTQNKGYKIKIKVAGMQDSTCYLINYFGDKRYYKDTAQFNSQGIVLFSGEEQHQGGIYTLYTGSKVLFEFVINDEPVIDLETDTNNLIMNMKVNKSKENEIFFGHIQFITKKQKASQPFRNKLNSKGITDKEKKEINGKLAEIGKEVNKYRLDIIDKYPELFVSVIFKTMKEPEAPKFEEIENDSLKRLLRYEYVKNHYFDDVDFSDARINYTPLYHNKIDKYFKTIVYPMPDSIIKEIDVIVAKAKANDEIFKYTVHHLLSYYERSKIMGMDGVFSHIGLNYYTHELAFWADSAQVEKVQDRARKIAPLMIGKPAINLSLLDTSGKNWINLYRDVKAEYTVLVFWDPDCGHCKKELPKLVQYVDSVKSTTDIKVYSVSSHHNEEWKNFIRDNNIDFINVAVPKEVYEDQQKATDYIIKGLTNLKSLNYNTTYDIFTTPQIYLLDKSKKIIAKKLDTGLLKMVISKEMQRKKK
jgi:peroxiredoxin